MDDGRPDAAPVHQALAAYVRLSASVVTVRSGEELSGGTALSVVISPRSEVVASFFVKDLLLPWQSGARWLWDALVDADLASNSLNWQWTVGGSTDAALFTRVFNPTLQAQRYDPTGAYIRRWVPELARLSIPHIWSPATAPPGVLAKAGVRLGTTYPRPIVDHALAREHALRTYRARRPLSAAGGIDLTKR